MGFNKVVGDYWEPSLGFKYITDGEVYATSIHLASANLAVRWYKPPPQPVETTPKDYEEAIHILLGDEKNENLES